MKTISSNKFSIKAGRMIIDKEKVKALPDKGELVFFVNADSIFLYNLKISLVLLGKVVKIKVRLSL